MFLKFRRHFLLLAGFMLMLSIAFGQHRTRRRTYRLTESDTAKTLTVKRGSMISLTLPDHIDGGYRFDTIQFDHSVLQLKKFRHTPPATGSPVGAAGTGAWQFIAIKNGDTHIRLTATRPWNGGGTVTIFQNKVKVK